MVCVFCLLSHFVQVLLLAWTCGAWELVLVCSNKSQKDQPFSPLMNWPPPCMRSGISSCISMYLQLHLWRSASLFQPAEKRPPQDSPGNAGGMSPRINPFIIWCCCRDAAMA
ncbi:hypothetical protein VOLCADRAFT_98027 [Volvox carteri f. nagariensis]|uniref:Secreted protein n=1 Tax=Volvox carteri f. nagariensis TaxID=3068 RepID=D8UE93_VOLCA|nr:uncharacterized protein VOLCADRAFT_98027 [Volvox carteri f. nagariensis]EFJ41927.1 hypothetical protein VOLCADRAFT_98027 [Volvox carteri f. nagariensis]|eukprot:XP_002956964.1 hypothetical protein VOLCADRAFT_98027 [Volvox carteri f. nagariensis]